jgi:hypothetical protein
MKLTRPLTRSMAALATLALVAAACGGGGESADSTAPSTSSSTTTSTTTTTEPPATTAAPTTSTTVPETIRQPLTGAPLGSVDEIIARPALVAKIDNNPAAVPNHSGLAVADIVFEEVVEGRTTRFAAAFHSQSSDPVGPIRSGRTQDVDLFTSFFFPLFVWSGGNAGVTRAINDSTLINMGPNNARGYFRGPGRAPHNYFTSTDVIWEQAPGDEPIPPRQQFLYLEADQSFGGEESNGVSARIGSEAIEWTWNPEFSKFDRSQRGRAHDDALFGRIRATNVVVMGVQYLPSSVDRRSPEAQTVGTGPVWVFSDGGVITGSWTRDVNTEPLSFVSAEGEPIALNVGNTWIELADIADVEAGRVEVLPSAPPTP